MKGRRRSFSLSIVGAGATGLFSTDSQAITLFDSGGVIEGRYGAANTVAFTLTIDATTGDVTLTQLQSLRHPTGGLASPDELVSLATGALNAVLTVTDGDGDVATSTADLGNVDPVRGRRADGALDASGVARRSLSTRALARTSGRRKAARSGLAR